MHSLAAILTASLVLSPLIAADAGNPTAYDLLEDFDFPVGLLPKGVKSYALDRRTGRFEAALGGACSFWLEGGSYRLHYKSTISGYVSRGRLSRLAGISVRVLFAWLDIGEVVRRGDELLFSFEFYSAVFPVDNFRESPRCGCGFRCGDGERMKLNVSSV